MRLVMTETESIALDGRIVDQLIRTGSGDAALLYLYMLRTGGAATFEGSAKALGRSRQEIAQSVELLKKLGFLTYGEMSGGSAGAPPVRLQKEETPNYSAEDIKRELENGSMFYALVQEVQKSMGKLLSSDDLIKLFGIYDSLGLPPEVILHLVAYCIDENRRRYGPGRVPTMRYIEKTAFTWEREGILTLDAAERYIKQMESKRGFISDLKKILQIKDRELTSGERQFVEGWIALGFSAEVIELAYDRTLVKTGRLAWKYMDSILNSWHQKGLRTVKDIEAKDTKGAVTGPAKKPLKTSKSTAPTMTDIEHMKKFLEKLREE